MAELCGSRWGRGNSCILISLHRFLQITCAHTFCSDFREIQAPWRLKVHNTLNMWNWEHWLNCEEQSMRLTKLNWSLSHNRFKVAQGKKEDKERRRPRLHWQEKGMSRPLLCLSNDELYRHNTNTSLTSLGGQESPGKLNKEEGRQTGSRDPNTDKRKGCTSKASQIQERKVWQTPGSQHSWAWKEINCT